MSYDSYLSNLADAQTCVPEIVGKWQDYNGEETDTIPIYNCEGCENTDCENYKKFN